MAGHKACFMAIMRVGADDRFNGRVLYLEVGRTLAFILSFKL